MLADSHALLAVNMSIFFITGKLNAPFMVTVTQ